MNYQQIQMKNYRQAFANISGNFRKNYNRTEQALPGRCYAHAASDAVFRRPAWLCLRFASCAATQQNATFWAVGRLWLPNSNSADISVNAPWPYPQLRHPMFTCLEVIVLTNTPTNTQTNTNPQTNRRRCKHPTLEVFASYIWRWVTTLQIFKYNQ